MNLAEKPNIWKSGMRPDVKVQDALYWDALWTVAWGDASNLVPGHSQCNSSTAHQAKGFSAKTAEIKARQLLTNEGFLA